MAVFHIAFPGELVCLNIPYLLRLGEHFLGLATPLRVLPNVALVPPAQSLDADGQAETKQRRIHGKVVSLTWSLEETDPERFWDFAPHSGDAGGGGAIFRSAGRLPMWIEQVVEWGEGAVRF